MNWLLAILIMSIVALVGIVIAFLVHKIFENMEKTSKYFEQIAKDLIKIDKLVQEGEQMIVFLGRWRKQNEKM